MSENLYVENTYGGDVTVIDTATATVTASYPVGEHIDDVAASPDGSVLYLSRQGTRDIVAVDAATGDPLWAVALTGLPHHIALSTDGAYLYVAIFNEMADNVVDVRSRSVVAEPLTGFGSHGVSFTPSGGHVYVGSLVFDHIAVVETGGWTVERAMNFDQAVRPFCLTADESVLYVQLSRTHGFHVVDPKTGEVTSEVSLPGELKAETTFPHTADHGIGLTPDGSRLFVAATTSNFVAAYAMPDLRLLATIPVGEEPGWITFGTDGSRCYVSSRRANTVSVLDVEALTETHRIPVGSYPQRMAVAQTKG